MVTLSLFYIFGHIAHMEASAFMAVTMSQVPCLNRSKADLRIRADTVTKTSKAVPLQQIKKVVEIALESLPGQ